MPEMIHVESTSIAAVGYDEALQDLYVRFVSGKTYVYSGVPSNVFDAFLAASSKGLYFNREIRSAYRFRQQ